MIDNLTTATAFRQAIHDGPPQDEWLDLRRQYGRPVGVWGGNEWAPNDLHKLEQELCNIALDVDVRASFAVWNDAVGRITGYRGLGLKYENTAPPSPVVYAVMERLRPGCSESLLAQPWVGYEQKPEPQRCGICGKEFYLEGSSNRRYCSPSCSKKAAGITKRKEKPEWTCKWCGKRFRRFKSRAHDVPRFCNKVCYLRWMNNTPVTVQSA